MKYFWYSLIAFCLLMCSCKSKEEVSDVQVRHNEHSELSYYKQSARVDTTKTIYSEQLRENKVIKETIIITEYDKDTGAVTKETKTDREIRQGSETNIGKEKQVGVTLTSADSLNFFRAASMDTDAKVKEETQDSTKGFWTWLGIVIGFGITIFFIYICRKLRIN